MPLSTTYRLLPLLGISSPFISPYALTGGLISPFGRLYAPSRFYPRPVFTTGANIPPSVARDLIKSFLRPPALSAPTPFKTISAIAPYVGKEVFPTLVPTASKGIGAIPSLPSAPVAIASKLTSLGRTLAPVGVGLSTISGIADILAGNVAQGASSLGGTAIGGLIGAFTPLGLIGGAGLGGLIGSFFGGFFGGSKKRRARRYRAAAEEANRILFGPYNAAEPQIVNLLNQGKTDEAFEMTRKFFDVYERLNAYGGKYGYAMNKVAGRAFGRWIKEQARRWWAIEKATGAPEGKYTSVFGRRVLGARIGHVPIIDPDTLIKVNYVRAQRGLEPLRPDRLPGTKVRIIPDVQKHMEDIMRGYNKAMRTYKLRRRVIELAREQQEERNRMLDRILESLRRNPNVAFGLA